jgi:phosphate transport system permease protein
MNWGDFTFRQLTAVCALAVLLSLAAMAIEMVGASSESIRHFGAAFVMGRAWEPVTNVFGALPFIWGTLASSTLALTIAVPVSFGVAVYLSELAPAWLREPLGFVIELLAAVPSVVYGLWGIFVLAPWLRESVEPLLARSLGFLPLFQGPHHGFGMLAAGLMLSIMITPTIS